MSKIKVNEISKHDASEIGVNDDVVLASGKSVSSPSISTDTISEKTSAAGVTIDGVLLKDGNVDGVDVSALNTTVSSITQGIKTYDCYEVTSNITSDGDITSNLARETAASRTLVTNIGTGMTESSGIFSFPSTGKWKVTCHIYAVNNTADTILVHTIATDDNFSSSDEVAIAKMGNNSSSSPLGGGASSEVVLDIEDISTDKVKFKAVSIGSGSYLSGTLDGIKETYFVFERLGDT
tara:strand:- start:226 stop:936 length:711 start_codon:yes stop_codon:yes gene_type:complete